jgi:hypothetical protein
MNNNLRNTANSCGIFLAYFNRQHTSLVIINALLTSYKGGSTYAVTLISPNPQIAASNQGESFVQQFWGGKMTTSLIDMV